MSTLDVDKLIPEPSKEDLKEVVALLGLAKDNVIDLVKESQKIRFDGGGSASNLAGATKLVGGYKDKMDELTLAMNEYQKATNQVSITQARFDAMNSDSGKQLVDNRDKLRQLTNELRAQGDAYKELVLKQQAASAEALRLGAEYGRTNQQYIAAAARARALSQELLALEQSVGRNFRQVGNYNLVGHEFSQILRELPSFAYSAGTGILSLSNNFPMFLDRIKQLRSEGVPMNQIIKQLGIELVSPINLITLATAAITIFAARMSESKKATDEQRKSVDDLSEAYDRLIEKQIKQKNIQTGGLYGGATQHVTISSDEQKEAQRQVDYLKALQTSVQGTDQLASVTDKLKKAEADLADIKAKDIDLQHKQNAAILDYAKAQLSRSNTRSLDQINAQAGLNSVFGVNTASVAKDVNDAIKAGSRLIDFQNAYAIEQQNINERAKDQENQKKIALLNDEKRAQRQVDLTNEELAVEERVNKARAERRKADLEDDAVHQKNIADNSVNSLDERLKALNEYIEDKRVINGIDEQRELKDIQDKLSKIDEIEQISDSKRTAAQKKLVLEKPALLEEELTITSKYASKDVALTEEQEKEKTKIVKEELSERQFTLEAYFRAVGKGLQDAYEGQAAYAKKELELQKQLSQAKLNLRKEESDALIKLGQIVLDREMSNLDDKQNALERDKDYQLSLIDAMNISDQQRADLKKAVDEDTYAKEQDIAKDRKRIQREEFYLQQTAALANVAISAQEAVAKIEAEAAVLAATPATATLAPLALAQIPTVIASAAISAGIIGAQIIAYGDGTEYHPYDSYAILGDKYEPELVQEPSGKTYWSGDSPELHFLPKGTSVTPLSQMDNYLISQLQPIKEPGQSNTGEMIKELKALRKEISDKPVPSLHIDNGSISKSIRRGNQTTNFIKRNIVD